MLVSSLTRDEKIEESEKVDVSVESSGPLSNLNMYLTFHTLGVSFCFVHLGPWWFRKMISSMKCYAKWYVYVHSSEERVNSFHTIFKKGSMTQNV